MKHVRGGSESRRCGYESIYDESADTFLQYSPLHTTEAKCNVAPGGGYTPNLRTEGQEAYLNRGPLMQRQTLDLELHQLGYVTKEGHQSLPLNQHSVQQFIYP